MEISVRELKSRLSEYLRKAAAGEEVLVTSRGKAVARLLPPGRRRQAVPSAEGEAIALLQSQPWVRPGKTGRQRVGLAKPVKLKPGTKSLSETVIEMRD